MVASLVRVEEPETCRVLLRLRLEREKEEVRLESMPIVRDLGITDCWRVGEIGPRSRRGLCGGTFCFC
jgi:hypothetical protein